MEGIRELRAFSIKTVGIYLGGGGLLGKHLAICTIPSDTKEHRTKRRKEFYKNIPKTTEFNKMISIICGFSEDI